MPTDVKAKVPATLWAHTGGGSFVLGANQALDAHADHPDRGARLSAEADPLLLQVPALATSID